MIDANSSKYLLIVVLIGRSIMYVIKFLELRSERDKRKIADIRV